MEASRRISKEGQGRGFLPKNVKRSSAIQLNFANRELYGRTQEIQVLQNALDYCLLSKEPFIVFVNGPSGVGKSSLIAKMQELVPDAGHYVSGKFEQRAEALRLANNALNEDPNYVKERYQKDQLWGPKLRAAARHLLSQPELKTAVERASANANGSSSVLE